MLLILWGGLGWAAKASRAERAAEAAKIIGQAEEKLQKVNLIARSAAFVGDTQTFPQLCKIHWLEEETWLALKASAKILKRLDEVVEWIFAVRHVPGAEKLILRIVSRLHLDNVEGELFQLKRAAEYAKEGKLAGIGIPFKVSVVLPGKPVKTMLGDADLILTDGTLVETKLRNGTALGLDEKLQTQLLKYKQAVAEGQFKRILLECNGPVSRQVKERCSVIADAGTPLKIAENLALDL